MIEKRKIFAELKILSSSILKSSQTIVNGSNLLIDKFLVWKV